MKAATANSYKPKQVLEFVSQRGIPYQIRIEAIAPTEMTIRNLRKGCRSMTLPTKAALEILESDERVR